MDYRDYSKGLFRDYYRDPFRHSLLSTREMIECAIGRLHGQSPLQVSKNSSLLGRKSGVECVGCGFSGVGFQRIWRNICFSATIRLNKSFKRE